MGPAPGRSRGKASTRFGIQRPAASSAADRSASAHLSVRQHASTAGAGPARRNPSARLRFPVGTEGRSRLYKTDSGTWQGRGLGRFIEGRVGQLPTHCGHSVRLPRIGVANASADPNYEHALLVGSRPPPCNINLGKGNGRCLAEIPA